MKFRVYKIFWESCISSIYGNYCAVCWIDIPCKKYLCGWFFWENSKYTELKYIKNTVDWCPLSYKSVKNWARHKACKTAILIKICPNVLKIMKTAVLRALWWAQFLTDLYKTGHQSAVLFMYFNSINSEFSQKIIHRDILCRGHQFDTQHHNYHIWKLYNSLKKSYIP